jgi:hypothetical protein
VRVGPRAGLDVIEKRGIYFPYRESNSDSSVIKLVVESLF